MLAIIIRFTYLVPPHLVFYLFVSLNSLNNSLLWPMVSLNSLLWPMGYCYRYRDEETEAQRHHTVNKWYSRVCQIKNKSTLFSQKLCPYSGLTCLTASVPRLLEHLLSEVSHHVRSAITLRPTCSEKSNKKERAWRTRCHP